MSFRPKPWYFERDCPFCTRSASSFCRNPLNFLEHAMWVKWWYLANFQPFQSSFLVLFNFRVIFAQNKSWNAWKIANEVRKGLKSDDVALNGAFWTHKKSGVQISSRKWNAFCNRRVSVRNPHTSKETVRFVHEVHPVFAVTHSTF